MTTFAPHDTESRNLGIGTSDAATVMGEGYKTRIELWKEKTGQIEVVDQFIERAFWGTELEEPILRNIPKIMEERGFKFLFIPINASIILSKNKINLSHFSYKVFLRII